MSLTKSLLQQIYGQSRGREADEHLERLIEQRRHLIPTPDRNPPTGGLPLDSHDAFLITYGDQFLSEGRRPLECLSEFADRYLEDLFTGIHILPFFPYSSDDGFSIIDYRSVDRSLGTWDDISRIGKRYRLMSDLVLNHCSVQSEWFRGFLRVDKRYRDYFITADPDTDYSMIVRPRSLPLLTKFETDSGIEHVWTTFSPDQVDLNFSNPEVLLELIDVFLFHLAQGVQVIRLDAIAYVWKDIGHPSIHHEKTHAIVQLFRAICDSYFPWVIIITETNVPHHENISYFGDGRNEAHMVYQFSLPPLTLDAFVRGDGTHLSRWAASITGDSNPTTYFNFLASHDGVGVTPTHGILTDAERASLVGTVKERGGLVSFKSTAEGEIPYELNVSYRDAVTDPDGSDHDRALQFVAAQAIMLTVVGVPGVYVHSLIGSGNYAEGVRRTGANRTINREKLDFDRVRADLDDPESIRSLVYTRIARLLSIRRDQEAFHPRSSQRVVDAGNELFCVVRSARHGSQTILAIVNLTASERTISIQAEESGFSAGSTVHDLAGSAAAEWRANRLESRLSPFQVVWLTERPPQ